MFLTCYNIGILGTAFIAHNGIIRPSQKRSDVALYGIASRTLKKAKAFGKLHHIPHCVEGYQTLLDDENVDIVYICLPNHLHFEWAKKALLANKHVICEKPLALGMRQALELVTLAKERHLMLSDGMHYRYYPRWRELFHELQKDIRKVKSIDIRLGFPLPSYPNIRLMPECYGGAFMHLSCYLVDVLFTLFPNTWLEIEAFSSKCFRTRADLWSEIIYSMGPIKGRLVSSFLEETVNSDFMITVGRHHWRLKHFFDPTIILGSSSLIDQVMPVYKVIKDGVVLPQMDYNKTTYDFQLETFLDEIKGARRIEKMVNIETCSFLGDCISFLYTPQAPLF